MQDWIAISSDELDEGAAIRFVTHDDAGGIDVFLGTTRAERHADGRALVALEYEAYAEMAAAEMGKLVAECRGRWPVLRCAVLHRTGRVAVGKPSVVIAVSTPHRAEAFEACRFLIDGLKDSVPIWKQEVWSDGGGSWVHPERGR